MKAPERGRSRPRCGAGQGRASHGVTDLAAHKLHFCDCWAPGCDKVNRLESSPLPSLLAQPQFSHLYHENRKPCILGQLLRMKRSLGTVLQS